MLINEEQKRAIKAANKALKKLHDCGVFLAGMDSSLFFATEQAIREYKENEGVDWGYCNVANAASMSGEGTGELYSKNYQDSGGW